jgi:hypothetical protein
MIVAGDRFGHLVALARIGRRNGNVIWLCLCDCLVMKGVQAGNLRSGHTKSCGCRTGSRPKQHELTAARLHELLNYDPQTGFFSPRLVSRRASIVGTVANTGYVQINIDGKAHLAHRLAWLHVYGQWPPQEIDHANCHRSDNRLANLRLATHAENSGNLPLRSTNTSGFKGVSFSNERRRWGAMITYRGRTRHLGRFASAVNAHRAYVAAAEKLFGEFANDGARGVLRSEKSISRPRDEKSLGIFKTQAEAPRALPDRSKP